jgi:putative transposase
MSEYNTLNHCKFLIQYHIIWCPKFRFNVLKGSIESDLKNILHSIADRYDYTIKELEVMPDHIHMFVSTKPTVVVTEVVRTFKSISAIMLFKKYPN